VRISLFVLRNARLSGEIMTRPMFIQRDGTAEEMLGADMYDIDIYPKDFEEGGKYWQAPVFETGEYGGAIPIPIGMEDYELPDNVSGVFDFITKPAKAIAKVAKGAVKSAGKVVGDVVHTANQAARLVTSPLNSVPILGDINKTILNADPAVAISNLANSIIAGERIDKAFLEAGKNQLKAIKEIAPYAQFVASFVPGVGTGVAAALAAGVALSEGRTITDAVLDAAVNAIPGGPLAKGAARTAIALGKGQSIDAAAMQLAKTQLPPAAYTALETARKVARGTDPKLAIMRAVRSHLPPDQQKALDIGLALAQGRNIQSKVLAGIVRAPPRLATIGAVALKKAPQLTALAAKLPNAVQKKGFETAAGLMSQKGVNAHAVVALRSVLPAEQKKGFDIAIKKAVDAANPQFNSLVSRGMVLRGNWKPCAKNTPGATAGRLIQGGKMVKGVFQRV
jgi:hypothetical protein